jgi:hypothetical protein
MATRRGGGVTRYGLNVLPLSIQRVDDRKSSVVGHRVTDFVSSYVVVPFCLFIYSFICVFICNFVGHLKMLCSRLSDQLAS